MLAKFLSVTLLTSLLNETDYSHTRRHAPRNVTGTGKDIPLMLFQDNSPPSTTTEFDPFLTQILHEEQNLTPAQREAFKLEEEEYDLRNEISLEDKSNSPTVYPILRPEVATGGQVEVVEEVMTSSNVQTNDRNPFQKAIGGLGAGLEWGKNAAEDLVVNPVNEFVLKPANQVGGAIIKPFSDIGGSIFGRKKAKTSTTPSPTTPTTPTPIRNEVNLQNCPDPDLMILHQGSCHPLLRQGPCPEGHWLLESEIQGQGVCKPTPCVWREVNFNGTCVQYNSRDVCHPGMEVKVSRAGEVECDCRPKHIFNPKDGNCYEAYSQGPCRFGYQFALVNKAQEKYPPRFTDFIDVRNLYKKEEVEVLEATCVRNPCRRNGRAWFKWGCVMVDTPCVSDEASKRYTVDWRTLQMECVDTVVEGRELARVPNFACPPGTRRNAAGKCQRTVKVDL